MNRLGKALLALVVAFSLALPCVMYFNKDAATDDAAAGTFSEEKFQADLTYMYKTYNGDISKKDKNDKLALNRLVVGDYNGKLYGSAFRAWDKKHKIGYLQYNTRKEAEEAAKKIRSDGFTVDGDAVAEFTDGAIDAEDLDTSSSSSVSTSEKGTFHPFGSEYLGTAEYINKIAMKTDDIIVATVDTGVMYDHTAIADRFYSHGVDLSGDGKDDAYYDTSLSGEYYGHGTMVSGIVADNTPDNVKLYPVKVVQFGQSYATTSAILNGFYAAVDAGADVITCSLATSGCENQLAQVISNARTKGICVCASAGNNSTVVKDRYPSATPYAITVSSIKNDGTISSTSNYGDCIDFCAPGRKINSTFPLNGESGFNTASGTSFSTPYIAACCACIKSVKKDMSRDDVYDTLCDFAKDLGDEGYDIYYGHGAPYIGNMVYTDGESYTYKIPEGTLEIEKAADYTSDTQPWKRFNDRIVSVKVDSSVERIGNYNFYNMKSASFDMKDSYDKIGQYAFYGCTQMDTYSCTVNSTELGEKAFGGIDDFTLKGYRNTAAETYAINEKANFVILGCNHDYKRVVYDPTKTKEGYTLYTCNICSDSYTGPYIEPTAVESGKCGENLTYTFYDTGRLTIDGSGDMYDYTNTSAPWSGYKSDIMVLQIKDGVGEISPFAFYGCSSLSRFFVSENNTVYCDYEKNLVKKSDSSLVLAVSSSVYEVPDYVKSFNASAFAPVRPETIDGGGFETRDKIVYDKSGNIVMALPSYKADTLSPGRNIKILDYAFIYTKYPSKVESDYLNIEAGKYSLGYYYDGVMNKRDVSFSVAGDGTLYAYAQENGFTADTGISGKCGDDIVWRYNETTFKFTLTGSGGMYSYSSRDEIPYASYISYMTSAEIDEDITSLSPYAFNNAFRLYTLTLPLSIEAPDETVWEKCTAIKTITLTLGTGIMDDYVTEDGTELYKYTPWYLSRKNITSFKLDENVKKITSYAFMNSLAIESLTFNCVEEIEDFAFIACTNLKTVTNYSKNTVYYDHSIFSYRFGTAAPGTYKNRTLRGYSDSTSKDLTDSNTAILFESLGCGHSRNTSYVRTDDAGDYVTNTIYSCSDCGQEFVKESVDGGVQASLTLVNLGDTPIKGAEIYVGSTLLGTTDENGNVSGKIKKGTPSIEVKLHGISVFTSTLNAESAVNAKIQIRYANYVNDGAVNGKDYAYAKKNGFNDKELFDYGKIKEGDSKIIYEN